MAACFSSSPCRYFYPLLCSYRRVQSVPYTHDYSVMYNRSVCQWHAWSVLVQVVFLSFSPFAKFDWGFVSSGYDAGCLPTFRRSLMPSSARESSLRKVPNAEGRWRYTSLLFRLVKLREVRRASWRIWVAGLGVCLWGECPEITVIWDCFLSKLRETPTQRHGFRYQTTSNVNTPAVLTSNLKLD
jgi:hypothetical protein